MSLHWSYMSFISYTEKTLLSILLNFVIHYPDVPLNRLYIDFLTPVNDFMNLKKYLDPEHMPYCFENPVYNYETLKERAVELWKDKKIDMMFTRTTNQLEVLNKLQIPYIHFLPTEEMVRDSLLAVEKGFHVLKVKVGKGGAKDVERIREIRNAVGKDIVIRVDANQGWTREEAVSTITAMEDAGLGIELVEQPVSYHDFKGMQYVTAQVETPILADESVFSYEDAVRLMEEKGADLINIKLMKTGGIHEAVRICDAADQFGVKCMIGCMLESKVSVSAGVHLAAARSCVTMADLDGPSLCRIDPYEGGPVYEGPHIFLKEDNGIGITGVPVKFETI